MVSEIEVEGHEPSQEKDPCRYFERLFEEDNLPQATKDKDGEDQLEADDDPRHKLLLSLSYAHITEGYSVPKSLDVLLDREYGPETHQDELKLRLMFGLLHGPLLRSHAAIWKETSFPRMTPSEFCNHLMHDDESLLLKLVYALATGEMTLPMQKITKDRTAFSRFMACGIAKEMIQRLEMEQPGPLQWMMRDVLSIVNAPKATKDFMSKIRVAAHRTTVDRESTKKSMSSTIQKLNLDPLDAFYLHFDTVGFKGKKKKWSQHTVIQICVIKYEELRKAGFYDSGSLSRERKTFDRLILEIQDKTGDKDHNEVAKHAAQRVVGVRKKDWEILST